MGSLGSFSLDLSKFAKKAMGGAKDVVGKACTAIGEDIKSETPFDTGRAKVGWIWQTGSKSEWKPPKGHYPVTKGPKLSPFNLGDTLYLANNVEYIKVLEDGWSKKQAPAGMAKVTLTRWQNYVAKAVASL